MCPNDPNHDGIGDPCNHNEDGDYLQDPADNCPFAYAEPVCIIMSFQIPNPNPGCPCP